MDVRDKIYVNGAWVPSTGNGTLEVIDSATEEVFATIPEGTPEDVDRAVQAAAAAFPGWAATSHEERGKLLKRIGEALAARTDEIAAVISHEVGMPMTLSGSIQVGLPAGAFADAANAAEAFDWEEELGNSLVVHEPVGVVGAITPWNYPLYQVVLKVAPALAAGCTVVLKPSEVAPINAFILAEIIDEVGLPPGVFNLVSGVGPVVGEAIASHPKVDMVSFTGSTRAGRRVMELAAEGIKRVSLELGGKSANILLDDADFATAVPAGRLRLLHELRPDLLGVDADAGPARQAGRSGGAGRRRRCRLRPGRPLRGGQAPRPLGLRRPARPGARLHQEGYRGGGQARGGRSRGPEGLEKGFYVQPTVFSDVTPDMTIAKEEIFGPVLSIIPYDTEEEAIEIANGTPYGLAGAVWSGDPARAERVARQMRTGQVDINGGQLQPERAVRRLQAVGHRPRARQVRPRGVRRDQVDAALTIPSGGDGAVTSRRPRRRHAVRRRQLGRRRFFTVVGLPADRRGLRIVLTRSGGGPPSRAADRTTTTGPGSRAHEARPRRRRPPDLDHGLHVDDDDDVDDGPGLLPADGQLPSASTPHSRPRWTPSGRESSRARSPPHWRRSFRAPPTSSSRPGSPIRRVTGRTVWWPTSGSIWRRRTPCSAPTRPRPRSCQCPCPSNTATGYPRACAPTGSATSRWRIPG